MENKLLDYLTILHTQLDNKASEIDWELEVADDGEGRTVQFSQEYSASLLKSKIADLQTLETDIRNLPFTKLNQKYSH